MSLRNRVKRQNDFGLRIADCGMLANAPRSPLLAPRSSPGTLWVAPRSTRRGVLLLVVLSMLVLFMLIGTAFLMTSNQSRVNSKHSATQNRVGNLASRILDD